MTEQDLLDMFIQERVDMLASLMVSVQQIILPSYD